MKVTPGGVLEEARKQRERFGLRLRASPPKREAAFRIAWDRFHAKPEQQFLAAQENYQRQRRELFLHVVNHYETRDVLGEKLEKVILPNDRDGQWYLRRLERLRTKVTRCAEALGVKWP